MGNAVAAKLPTTSQPTLRNHAVGISVDDVCSVITSLSHPRCANHYAALAKTANYDGYSTAQSRKCHGVPAYEPSGAAPFDSCPTGDLPVDTAAHGTSRPLIWVCYIAVSATTEMGASRVALARVEHQRGSHHNGDLRSLRDRWKPAPNGDDDVINQPETTVFT